MVMHGHLMLTKPMDPTIPPRVLKEAAYIITPLVTELFRRSLQSGEVPLTWSKGSTTVALPLFFDKLAR